MDELDLYKLTTEAVNMEAKPIETLSIEQLLQRMNEEDKKVPYAVEKVIPQISLVVQAAIRAIKQGGRLIYIGAGTSGRLGLVDASECAPTFGTTYEVQALIAGGKEAFISAKEGVEDSKELGEEDLKKINFNQKDILVGIAASGRTPYVIGALRYARSLGAVTAALSCNKNAPICCEADIAIEVEAGPEVLAGSTRLKAGTAQKLVLNMISTTAMVNCGKVYKSLMVDMKATNEKLEARSKRIVMLATGCTREQAEQALLEADYHAKLAIVMILAKTSRQEAEKLLKSSEGNVGAAVSEYI